MPSHNPLDIEGETKGIPVQYPIILSLLKGGKSGISRVADAP